MAVKTPHRAMNLPPVCPGGATLIAHNTGKGIAVTGASTLEIYSGSEVRGNGEAGIEVSQASTIRVNALISGNGGDGIALRT
jgi:hypothetical protein